MNRRRFLQSAFATGIAPVFSRLLGAAEVPRENDKIKSDRQAALDILRPSNKDLEHGLDLHRSSLVIDSYAFSPRAAIDNAILAKLMNSGANEQEIVDASEDMSMTRYVTDEAERDEYLNAWSASGVTCIVQNSGEEGNDPLRLLKRLSRFTYVTDHLREQVSKAATAEQILATKQSNKHCLCMTTNGVPLVQQWVSAVDEMRYMRPFYELGVRMMHLTYNRRNPIGDGCGEANDAGLSDFGRQVVAHLNRTGIIADCAHSGLKTSLDAAKTSSKPMVASHSCVAALNQHIRAKTDEVIKAIADTGGVIGICCIGHFLGGSQDIAVFLNHVDYVVKRFGVDHVAIGTDIAYASRLKPNDAKLPARGPQRDRWEQLWPAGSRSAPLNPRAFASMAWTNWPLFTVGLVQKGYSDVDIQKIIGGNMLRVIRANEP